MDRYRNFSLDEWVWDTTFRNWVLNPTREDDETWQNWLAANPDKAELVERARQLVSAIRPENAPMKNPERRIAIDGIVSRLENRTLPERVTEQWFAGTWIRVAAMLLLVLGLGWGFQLRNGGHQVNYEQLVAAAGDDMLEKANNTSRALTISLEDGSRVTLDPGSKMGYPAHFKKGKREVFLSGKAFFDITKDPSRPFFVYANELVTKVLGTSFTVRSFANEKEVSVAVKTGKVAVFSREDPSAREKQGSRELTGVVIEPNQQIVFVRETVKITKSIVPQPEIVEHDALAYHFEFDEAPVSTVFSTLQRAYGIDIIYDKNMMDECPITARLTDMSLYEQLDLVCKAVGASYELIDGRILIEGKGCKDN